MRAVLYIVAGPSSGQRVRLVAGEPLRVGRGGRADLIVSRDERMALDHFELTWDGATCRLRDLSRQGTELDGKRVDEAELKNGGWIVAGGTRFLFRVRTDDLRAELPPTPPLPLPSPELLAARREALSLLSREEHLFAILDAARDRRVGALLQACDDEFRSLYEGRKGDVLAEVAPYLVRLQAGSPLLPVLVEDGWGESWGVYLTSERPFKEVRRRLRQSLMVRDEASGKRLYFRFYDPRVLRAFWPTCTPRRRSEILGTEIVSLLVEGTAGEVLRFSRQG
ncbi:DUF4123 domain-containing protein [Polyangium spumosum]|uniref:DUF4123 domain-containing protein n=1 Tax=Polyangium spumosum TaxID=889282 RepID=A0A6N7PXV7_9BACT|nr:DUF4123 domain-containing protein [Polyangium spumosum]MRG96833.1 DUF4123 domain-containing protein [Polyangium spumosum]